MHSHVLVHTVHDSVSSSARLGVFPPNEPVRDSSRANSGSISTDIYLVDILLA